MIDWVMPPQTAVALYIYRVGRSCLARNPFTTRNSQGLLNSTRARGPPVRPVRPTGQTGVAVVGSATRRPTGQTVEGHPSDWWRQLDQPCAKFGCEQLFILYPDSMCENVSTWIHFDFCCLHVNNFVCLVFVGIWIAKIYLPLYSFFPY
jgi:hypothetical protein